MATTDHSKNLAFANGLDDPAPSHTFKKIREQNARIDGITIFAE